MFGFDRFIMFGFKRLRNVRFLSSTYCSVFNRLVKFGFGFGVILAGDRV
jgi:hypothetical protein